MVIFQSTPSARRATAALCTVRDELKISIPALREEGDDTYDFAERLQIIFQSTPSARRATVTLRAYSMPQSVFQSTPSARRATELEPEFIDFVLISIHALREEGDPSPSGQDWRPGSNFNPRPPRGGRRQPEGSH